MYGIGFVHARIGPADGFQLFQTLNVIFQILTPRAGTGRRNRVRRLHQTGNDCTRLYIVVMGFYRVYDILFFTVLAGEFHAKLDVRAFHFVIDGLAEIMQ